MSSHLDKILGWNTGKVIIILGWRAVFAVTAGTHRDKGYNAEDFHFEKNVAMADRRKLQAEVDRCLKKVQEGVDAFEDIWQKVQSANNLNQKEKYEADLKKEIKKLQRLREQIKTWASSSEIKDKQILLDNRKLIETQMERFKVVEKETKTKAYSKEGLGAGRRLDPMEKEREEVRQWLQDCIEKLGLQSEKLDTELEMLLNTKKKKGDKNDKVEAVKTQLQRHRHHVKSLEAILRLLTNESVEVEQVKNIQQNVDYYVDSNQDPDFEEDEYIYDDFDLESAESFAQKAPGDDEDDTEYADRAVETLSTNLQPSPHPAADNANNISNHSGSASNSTSSNNATRDKDPSDGRKRQKSVSEEQQQSAWKNAQLNSSAATTTLQPFSTATAATPQLTDGPAGQQQQHLQHSINLRLNAGPASGAGITRATTAAATTSGDGTPPTPPVTTVSGFAAAVAASLPPVAAAPPVQHNSYSNAVSTATGPLSTSMQSENMPAPGGAKGPRAAQQAAAVLQQQQPLPSQQQKAQNMEAVLRATEDKEAQPSTSLAVMAAPSAAAMPPPSSTPNSLPSSGGGSSVSSVSNSAMPSPAPSPAAAPVLPSAAPTAVALMQSAPATEGNSSTNKLPDAAAAYQNGLVHSTSAAIAKVLSNTDSIHSLRTAALEAVAASSLPNSNLFNSPSSSASNQLSVLPAQSPAADISHPPSAQSPAESESTPHYQTSTIRISPLLGIAPLGQQMLTKENTYQLSMVSAAFEHMPHPSDSERIRHYIPRNPCSTPAYYPQALAPQADSVEYFQRLSTETLFFVFYYMEGTKAQYLAAKALKKQSWRFHTKYLMWFQRHDEPKTITDEYEQGTYIYFDYEKWGQRRKDGFTFEYRYLEDKEL